jgi:serine/threonine-protein kinase
MSPEQTRGRVSELSPATDVWSLGAILYLTLTGTLPHRATDFATLVQDTVSRPVQDPRARAPGRQIPDELAAVCARAPALDPRERYPDGAALGQAVDAFLEGARRREEARERLREGMEARSRHESLGAALADVERGIASLERQTRPFSPIAEKAPLFAARDEAAQLRVARATAFADLVGAGERALSHDPGNREARAFLAQAWWSRFAEAEARRDEADQAWTAARVRAYDDGPYAQLLGGAGSLRLDSEPRGAELLCQEVLRRGPVWTLGEPRILGRCPVDVPLPMGSWLLTLRAPGLPDVRYPVHIGRGARWAPERPVFMPSAEQLGDGWVYVPAGPCAIGEPDAVIDSLEPGVREVEGFFVRRDPVKVRQYAEFLSEINKVDDDAAWARVPRREAGIEGESYLPPAADADGDSWAPDLPVFSVSWHDATAYADWEARRSGLPVCLPTELWWEKAARGVDGRRYPWGETADCALAKLRESQAGKPRPEPVGAYPHDVSPYGVRDVAGGVSEWCRPPPGEQPPLMPVRGGSWASSLVQARLCNRLGLDAGRVHSYLGFRLARPLA